MAAWKRWLVGPEGHMEKRGVESAAAGGAVSCDGSALGFTETLDRFERGSFIAHNGRYGFSIPFYSKINRCMEIWMYQSQSHHGRDEVVSALKSIRKPRMIGTRRLQGVYKFTIGVSRARRI
jgi:hypothetical protein